MVEPAQPDEVVALIQTFRADMERIWRQVKDEEARLIAQWSGQTPPVRVNRLATMQAQIRDLMARADEVINAQIPGAISTSYEINAFKVALQANAVASFTAVDTAAMTRLATETMDSMLSATQHVRDTTKMLVRTLTRDYATNAVVTGLTAEQAGIRLAAELAEQGIHAITYANGAKVGLATYTDMVMRTQTAIAYQEGGFQQGATLGIDWWEIMDGPNCGLSYHDDPTIADGMIVDTATAERYPISHPNCVRVTSPRPDITNAREARVATRTSPEAQVADNVAAAQARAAAYARRPRSVGLTNQVNSELSRRSSAVQLPHPQTAAQSRHARLVARSNQDGLGKYARITPETLTEAATKTNPHKALSVDYQHNCSYVVNAVELRARGYDVIASPVSAGLGRTNRAIALDWRTVDGGVPEFTTISQFSRTMKAYALMEATKDWPVGARGFVSGNYARGNSGHIMNFERTAAGVRIVEGQTAVTTPGEAAATFRRFTIDSIRIMRTDNLVPEPGLARAVQAPTAGADAVLVRVERARVTRDIQTVQDQMKALRVEADAAARAAKDKLAIRDSLDIADPAFRAAARDAAQALKSATELQAYYANMDRAQRIYRQRLAQLDKAT